MALEFKMAAIVTSVLGLFILWGIVCGFAIRAYDVLEVVWDCFGRVEKCTHTL